MADRTKISRLTMRRPIRVKSSLRFPQTFSVPQNFSASQAASVATLPSALVGERFSLGGFSRCCHLIIDPRFLLYEGSLGPGLSRSHLNSAVELGCSVKNSLGYFAQHLLAIAQRFVNLPTHPQPMKQYR